MKKILPLLLLLLISCKENVAQTKENTNTDVENYNKGNDELQAHNFSNAIAYYNEVIKATPITSTSLITAESYISRGVAKGELGDQRGAISDFSKVINTSKIQDLKAKAYYMRGIGYLKMEDYDSACTDWSKAGEFGITKAYELINQNCN